MANEYLGTLLRRLRSRVAGDAAGGLSDGQLLERFVGQRDEAAFEALFWRHAPMVLGVCRRLLPPDDAEDAFQAAFLVLVRKAASIGKGEALGGWLHRVAYRIALRARTGAAPALRELPPEGLPAAAAADDLVWRDLRPVLDEEINGLPQKYRAPIVLCYLEGKTNEEAARLLGCPKGTVAVRLMRGRERLRTRLSRRGLTLSAAVLGSLLAGEALAAVPAGLLASSTIKAALLCAAGQPIVGAASAHAAALAEGMVKSMFQTKLKRAAVVLLALVVLATGAGVIGHQLLVSAAPVPKDEAAAGQGGGNLVDVVARRDGVIIVVGTEIKPGEEGPGQRVVKVKRGSAEVKFRRLKVGDAVEEGQLIGLVEDELARDDQDLARAKVAAAEAEVTVSEKSRDEAEQRWAAVQKLKARGVIADEEFRAAKLSFDRFFWETKTKEAAAEVARLEMKRAQRILEQYEIRSRVRGVITKVNKYSGEGVHALEPVVQVRVADK
jgi:RNA polymerase sigma factor (sigma-70 family)